MEGSEKKRPEGAGAPDADDTEWTGEEQDPDRWPVHHGYPAGTTFTLPGGQKISVEELNRRKAARRKAAAEKAAAGPPEAPSEEAPPAEPAG